jgi:hypothetical protein
MELIHLFYAFGIIALGAIIYGCVEIYKIKHQRPVA